MFLSLQEMKTQESRETKGLFFVVSEDLKNAESLKSESARRTVSAILRHLQLIRVVRGPGSIVRYAVN
jgi:hypothetical protein